MYYKRGHNSLGETSDQRHRDGGSETEQGGPEPIPGLLEGFDLLTALGRLPLEHVAVVGFGRGGELGQRGAAPAVGTWKETWDQSGVTRRPSAGPPAGSSPGSWGLDQRGTQYPTTCWRFLVQAVHARVVGSGGWTPRPSPEVCRSASMLSGRHLIAFLLNPTHPTQGSNTTRSVFWLSTF